MKTKTIVRQNKIIELLEEGKSLNEISEVCKVNEKTIRRDLKKLGEDFPEKRDSSAIRILASKERLYRKSVVMYDEAKSVELRIRLLSLQNKLINSLERTYARFGLIPNEVDYEKKEEEMHILTQIKMQALEIYEKEKPREEAKKREWERLKQFEKDTLERQEQEKQIQELEELQEEPEKEEKKQQSEFNYSDHFF